MNDASLAFICAILAVALACVGIILPESSSFPDTYPYANLTGIPNTYPYGNLTGIPNTFPYGNLTGSPTFSGFANKTDIPQSFPYGNLTGIPNTFPYGNLTGVPVSYNLTDDLVLWMPLDDGSGNASDYSGCMNHGVIYGASWIDGKYGKALSFDGLNDYIQISQNGILPYGSAPRTISFWIKVPFGTNWLCVFSTGDTSVYRGRIILYSMATEERFYLSLWGNDFDIPNTGIQANTWALITLVYNGATTINIYVNNNTIPISLSLNDVLATISTSWVIGQVVSSSWFNGVLDEVRIYNRALTQAEITLLYNLP